MNPANSPIQHFVWVDFLRGVAALAVVIFHYHHFYLADALDRPSIPPIGTFPYATILEPLYSHWAANAVELFWLISGFVFAHVYLTRKTTAREFGVARFARLYPLHFCTLIYVAALQWFSLKMVGHWQVYGNNDLFHFVLQLFMSSNWPTFSWGLSFNGPIWSVSAEIFIYVLFFFALTMIRRFPLAVPLLLSAFFWGWFALRPVGLWYVSDLVFECGGYFFLGSVLYALRPYDRPLRAILIILLGAALVALGIASGRHFLIVPGASVAILCFFVALDRIAPRSGKRVTVVGDISYSLYLVHVPLQMSALLVADLMFDGSRAFANSMATLPIYVAVSVATAVLANKWLEKPAGRAIRKRLMAPPAHIRQRS